MADHLTVVPADPKGAAEFAYRRLEQRTREMFSEIQNRNTAHDAVAPISENSDAPKGAEDGCHLQHETHARLASVPPHAPEAALMTEATSPSPTSKPMPRSSTHAAEMPREQAIGMVDPSERVPARKNPPATEGDQAVSLTTTKASLPDPTIAPAKARRRKAKNFASTISRLPSDATVSADHLHFDDQATNVSSPAASCGGEPIPSNGGDVEGRVDDDAHAGGADNIAQIVQMHRMRRRWMKARNALILQAKAACRAFADGDKTAGTKLFDRARKGALEPHEMAVEIVLMPFLAAIERFDGEMAAIEKTLRKMAKALPVYPWVKSVGGFGEGNLAAIIGEAGDLSNYSNPAKLWKRMGLAVIGGERQRRVSDADLALVHGYNPERRSIAYLLGECLMKAKSKNPYGPLYDERKAYELTRVKTPAHAHNRAVRYITKRALRDLWRAWRDTGGEAKDRQPPTPWVPTHQ
jgi:hypothetical protein